jgi:hypothetical protein
VSEEKEKKVDFDFGRFKHSPQVSALFAKNGSRP